MKNLNSNYGKKNNVFKFFFSLLVFFTISEFSNGATINISVQDYSFRPKNVHAQVGDTLTWTWIGPHPHTITCDGTVSGTNLPEAADPIDVSLNSANPEFTYVIEEAGIYDYISQPYFEIGMTGIINAQVTLPVELTDFVATTIKNEVILDWFTGGEINNERFEVQRVNIKNFKDLDPNELPFNTVGILKGHGNSSNINHYKFKDRNLSSGKYLYRLKQVDYNSNFVYHLLQDEVVIGIPDKLIISQNYPNPFNPVTRINFELPVDGFVNISVFNINGKEVMELLNEFRSAGYQTVEINGSSLSSGVYYYKFSFDDNGNAQTFTKKMMLIK